MLKTFSHLLIVLIYSCASERPQGKTEAEVLYKEAQELMEDQRYILATEKLNILRSQHPYSFYSTSAELMQADVLFKQENYVESAAAYLMFKDLHPKHKQMSYVIYKIAESYFKQLPDTHDRDLSSAYEAIKYYELLINRYPSSKHKGDAKRRMIEAQEMLKSKESYIADFYYRTEVYEAARYRYLKILDSFLSDKKLMERSKFRVIKTSYLLREYDKCVEYGKLFVGQVTGNFNKQAQKIIGDCQTKLQ